MPPAPCPEVSVSFLESGNFRASGVGLNRTLPGFPGVLIVMPMPLSERRGEGSFSGQLHLSLGFVWL